ncbi:Cyanovirin-N [Podospora fimiseda]|uniref:Cyanovirin-N n=1 Tax=Podospora fimiseda TaxID=252190 RepID=A0AAN7BHE8_9PEZI|nr:Cyanovirin-N [Podospora fimiseda]
MKLITTILLSFFALTKADDFLSSCDASSVRLLSSGRILTATCRNILGQPKCSRLDLSRCIKNSYGRLEADASASGPFFLDQCIECGNGPTTDGLLVGGGTTLLHCRCNPGTGAGQAGWPTAFIDLNTLVDNNNGVLECFKVKGSAC